MRLLPAGSPGYDLSGSAANGIVTIQVPGTEPVGAQQSSSAHRRTPDFSRRGVQVTVEAQADNGDVTIEQ